LAIVSEIVAAHGGTVEVDSSIENGTEFRLTLPIATVSPVLLPAPAA
jgi:signal transduction histidine kinase